MKTNPVLALFCLSIASLFACGDDSVDEPKKDAGSVQVDSGVEDSGKIDPDAGGSTPVDEVACGTKLCKIEGLLGTFSDPCCLDESASMCGIKVLQGSDGKCHEQVNPDTRCESVELNGTAIVPSCCTADGQCGLDGTMYGMGGCTSIQDIVAAAAMTDAGAMAMPGVTIPEPRACDDADGGSEDGGR